jgi:hypothetical protein
VRVTSLPAIETAPDNVIAEAPLPEPFACQFCDAPAAAACPRCGALFCTEHGDASCDACSDPVSGVPSPFPVRLAAGLFVVAAISAVWLVLAPPRLRGEHPPPEAAAPPAATLAPGRGGAGQGTSPASGSPGGTGAAQGAGSPASGASPTAGAEKHTVKAGDTLGQIAAQYGTTVDALRAANPGLDERALQIGQEIFIPPR